MSDKVYVKIEGITGPVKVDGFTECFEANYFDGGDIANHFSASNNGQAYAGVPVVSDLVLSLKNCTGTTSSTLEQYVLKAQPLKEITISQISRVSGGKDTETHGSKYEKAHILAYKYDPASRDVTLKVGGFSSIENTHYDIDDDGNVKPMRVKYDLTKESVS